MEEAGGRMTSSFMSPAGPPACGRGGWLAGHEEGWCSCRAAEKRVSRALLDEEEEEEDVEEDEEAAALAPAAAAVAVAVAVAVLVVVVVVAVMSAACLLSAGAAPPCWLLDMEEETDVKRAAGAAAARAADEGDWSARIVAMGWGACAHSGVECRCGALGEVSKTGASAS